jgi:hypothetical protein
MSGDRSRLNRKTSGIGIALHSKLSGFHKARWIIREHFRWACSPSLHVRIQILSRRSKMASDKTSKRELIDTGNDKRFVRRDDKGRFDDVVDVGKSLAQDRQQHAKTEVEPGQGDRGDQKRRSE